MRQASPAKPADLCHEILKLPRDKLRTNINGIFLSNLYQTSFATALKGAEVI